MGTRKGENTPPSPQAESLSVDGGTPSRSSLLLIVVCVGLAVGLALFSWMLGNQTGRAARVQQADVQTKVLRNTDARIYHADLAHGHVTTIVSRHSGDGVLIIDGDTDPGFGKTFQLWTLYKAAAQIQPIAVSDQTFTPQGTSQLTVNSDLTAAVGFWITIEPVGGSNEPSSQVVLDQIL